ncbi:DNA repair protein RecN [Clostridium aceticum]|uniref:DNA repair protein RecN n=1 Tax=Clostridium aceticum TaxID=84022 RepID=A0A0D8ICY6_9CLOT|nr:DNA repair protein RecN [Clostridium aceticum]AKL95309.1 DNA repair protein RecN [Clostridium aceticum]KJF28153.1 DNA recombination protein RecN [Clostridium aceticum]
MLLELEVKDFALIDRLNLHFDSGLNILTGETGAGKSIIIDAVNMAIGERADRDYVRSGSKKSMIQAIFSTEDVKDLSTILEAYGIDWEEEQSLIVTREIYANGRSVSRVNGIIVNQGVLKLITEKLIDIHGQHQHQSLLNSDFHIDVLDAYGGKKIHDLLKILSEKHKKYLSLQKKLGSFCYDEMERERKIDLLKFQIEEIDNAELKVGEEEDLLQQKNLLGNSEKIYTTLATIYEDFYNSTIQPSVLDHISKNVKSLQSVSLLDEDLNHFYTTLEDLQYRLQDMMMEVRNYKDRIDFQPETLQEIEKRLDLLNNLKRKYGVSIKEVLDYREKIQQELDDYTHSEEKVEIIKKEIQKEKKELEDLSLEVSILRKNAARSFEEELIKILQSLNMKKVSFSVKITQPIDADGGYKLTSKGIDKVEFMLSSNAGEPLKPLSKVASGGEMSRVMLGLKTILAHVDGIPTLIFDEIDTGISGITAQTVGEKLYHISKKRQVICITHLPQIAAMADTHFLIEKETTKNTTITQINKLDEEKRLYELGRLLGGEITEITLKHAEEMIHHAHKKIKDDVTL